MPDENVSSDTLHDRKAAICPHGSKESQLAAMEDVAEDAIEYAAQLEDHVKDLVAECSENADLRAAAEHERDEARADRDRLHDALLDYILWPFFDKVSEEPIGLRCQDCQASEEYPVNRQELVHAEDCVLREVERGDTVAKIRREAFEEAVNFIRTVDWLDHHEQDALVDGIRELAEADNQEDD